METGNASHEHKWRGIDNGRMCELCLYVDNQLSPAKSPEQTAAPRPELRFEMSPSIGKLIEALAKARKQFTPILKESSNPFFKSKYADLAAVIAATSDGLSDNGLAVLQPPAFERSTGTVEVLTLLAHSSGQWLKAILDMPVSKSDAQGVGSAITYGRRYSYSGVLNVASEEDDDGNAAVSRRPGDKPKLESNEEFDQRTVDQQNIGVAQIKAIDEALKASGKTEDEIKAALGFIGETRIEHIKKGKFDKFLKWAGTTGKPTAATVKPASKIEPPKDTPRLKAMRRLWATAAEYSIPEHDVKQAAYQMFKVDSMTVLTEAQLDEMHDWVKSVASAVQES